MSQSRHRGKEYAGALPKSYLQSEKRGSNNGRKLLKLEKKEAERVQKFIEHKIDTKVAQRLLCALFVPRRCVTVKNGR